MKHETFSKCSSALSVGKPRWSNFTFTRVIGSCRQPLWGLGDGESSQQTFLWGGSSWRSLPKCSRNSKTGFYLTSGYFLRLDNSNFFRILLKVRELSEVDCSTNEKCGPTICKKIQAHEKTITNNSIFTQKK